MFDRLRGGFCQVDDFCQACGPHWQARLLREEAQPAKKRGPQAGLADSEIMTILVLYHSSHFKAFYAGVVLAWLPSAFPQAPCYARFIALTNHVWQGKRMIEFYSPTGPASGRHSSNERGSLRLVRSHPT